MRRIFDSHLYIGIISLLGIIGIYMIRNMNSNHMAAREGAAMEAAVRITVSAAKSKSELNGILDRAFEMLGGMEREFSTRDPASGVSSLNARAGTSLMAVSPDLYSVLQAAREVASMPDGAFDPTVGPVKSLWEDKKDENSVPSNMEILTAASAVGYDKLILVPPDTAFLDIEGGKLDLSGIKRGYAATRIKEMLVSEGVTSAMIDLGGDAVVFGGRPVSRKTSERTPWRIGIQDPSQPVGTALCYVDMYDGSVMTAGAYERTWVVDGRRYTHIFDPRRGRPIEGPLSSVTVISSVSSASSIFSEPACGDALSTAFMVMGKEASFEALRMLPGFDAVFITRDGDGNYEITATEGIRDSLKTERPDAAITFRYVF
jgi:thiamine biosynthesis lipoprotein